MNQHLGNKNLSEDQRSMGLILNSVYGYNHKT